MFASLVSQLNLHCVVPFLLKPKKMVRLSPSLKSCFKNESPHLRLHLQGEVMTLNQRAWQREGAELLELPGASDSFCLFFCWTFLIFFDFWVVSLILCFYFCVFDVLEEN